MNINLTLLGQMISFGIFVWFCMKFVWPPLIAAMTERQERIGLGLRNSERATLALDEAHAQGRQVIDQAKQQAALLIEQANKRANQLIDEARLNAKQEAERITASAMTDIDQSIQKAKDALRAQVSVLAVRGAEKILERTIDASAHQDVLGKLSAEL